MDVVAATERLRRSCSVRQIPQPRHDLPVRREAMERQPFSQARRLENGQRMRQDFVGRAPGIDFDDDGEQAGQHIRFARGR